MRFYHWLALVAILAAPIVAVQVKKRLEHIRIRRQRRPAVTPEEMGTILAVFLETGIDAVPSTVSSCDSLEECTPEMKGLIEMEAQYLQGVVIDLGCWLSLSDTEARRRVLDSYYASVQLRAMTDPSWQSFYDGIKERLAEYSVAVKLFFRDDKNSLAIGSVFANRCGAPGDLPVAFFGHSPFMATLKALQDLLANEGF